MMIFFIGSPALWSRARAARRGIVALRVTAWQPAGPLRGAPPPAAGRAWWWLAVISVITFFTIGLLVGADRDPRLVREHRPLPRAPVVRIDTERVWVGPPLAAPHRARLSTRSVGPPTRGRGGRSTTGTSAATRSGPATASGSAGRDGTKKCWLSVGTNRRDELLQPPLDARRGSARARVPTRPRPRTRAARSRRRVGTTTRGTRRGSAGGTASSGRATPRATRPQRRRTRRLRAVRRDPHRRRDAGPPVPVVTMSLHRAVRRGVLRDAAHAHHHRQPPATRPRRQQPRGAAVPRRQRRDPVRDREGPPAHRARVPATPSSAATTARAATSDGQRHNPHKHRVPRAASPRCSCTRTPQHLFGNLLFLWVFGNDIEHRWGRIRYLLLYLLGGLAASFAHVFLDPNSTVPMIGASGAIAAVMGAYAICYPSTA